MQVKIDIKITKPTLDANKLKGLGCGIELDLFKDGVLLSHSNPLYEFADSVAATFEFQGKDERNDTVTQLDTDLPFLDPERILFVIVKRVRGYPGANDDTPVSAVWRNGRLQHMQVSIISEEMAS